MRTLGKPAAGMKLAPKPRGQKTISDWRKDSKKVRAFEKWALGNQNNQCAFCCHDVGDVDHRRAWELDHFAPQGETLYPQWRFEPLNLLVSCTSCNGRLKGAYNSVSNVGSTYATSKFLLVHPYLDVIQTHMIGTYEGGKKEVGIPLAITRQGIATIEKFCLWNPSYITAVNKQAMGIFLDEIGISTSDQLRALLDGARAEVSGRR